MKTTLRQRGFSRLVVILSLAWLASACQLDEDCEGANDEDVPVAPLAPTAGTPMCQGTKRDILTQRGGTCRGRVAASMSTTGFCYLAADDNVNCSGVVGGIDYGVILPDTGQIGPDNGGTVGCSTGPRFAPSNNDGSIWCIGSNDNGQLGTGNTEPLATETMVARREPGGFAATDRG